MVRKNPEDMLAIVLLTSILITCVTYVIVNWNMILNYYLPPILLLKVVGLCVFSTVTLIKQIKRKRVGKRGYQIATIVIGTMIAIIGFGYALSEAKLSAPFPELPYPQCTILIYPNLVTGTIIVLVGIIFAMIGNYFTKIHILISRGRVERRYLPVAS